MKLHLTLLCISVAAVWCEVDVEKYLTQFGYHNPSAFNGKTLTASIKAYQKTFGLPQTGIADEATKKLMTTPRCGLSDHRSNAFADKKWSKHALTYYYNNFTPDLSQAQVKSLTRQALKYWSDVTPLTFRETQESGDIVISFGSRSHHDGRRRCGFKFDGSSGVLAHAFFPPDGRLHFDEDENYTSKSTSGINYLWVATHELGHILGLEHDTQTRDAIMYPYYRKYDPNGMRLHASDIRRVQAQYGRGTGGGGPQTQPPLTQAPPTNCQDSLDHCYKYEDRCDNYSQAWTKYMTTNCPKTCKKCGDGGSCTDKSSNCQDFTKYCKKPNWVSYMKQNCKNTCNYC